MSEALQLKALYGLVGKSALVTGGTRGIGEATALLFAELGARVIIVARDPVRLDACLEQWQSRDLDVRGISADLADREDRNRLISRLGPDPLDILVNNVGTNIRLPAEQYSAAQYSEILATNLESAFELSVALLPKLVASGDAAIANVSSVAGITHLGTGVPYGMSKAAMNQMTRNLAVEWAAQGIRVNAVCPWYTDTPLARTVLDKPGYRDAVLAHTPMGRIARADEVAAAIAFLCSPAASYVTGQCLAVDGGFSVRGFDAPVP